MKERSKPLRVRDVMSGSVRTVGRNDKLALADAARIMIEKKIGCLPVLEAGKLVGILTQGDFVALAARSG